MVLAVKPSDAAVLSINALLLSSYFVFIFYFLSRRNPMSYQLQFTTLFPLIKSTQKFFWVYFTVLKVLMIMILVFDAHLTNPKYSIISKSDSLHFPFFSPQGASIFLNISVFIAFMNFKIQSSSYVL